MGTGWKGTETFLELLRPMIKFMHWRQNTVTRRQSYLPKFHSNAILRLCPDVAIRTYFFNFIIGFTDIQQTACTSYVLVSLHLCQHLVGSVFFILAVLVGLKWYFIVMLVCISLMAHDDFHVFIYLLSWRVCLDLLCVFLLGCFLSFKCMVTRKITTGDESSSPTVWPLCLSLYFVIWKMGIIIVPTLQVRWSGLRQVKSVGQRLRELIWSPGETNWVTSGIVRRKLWGWLSSVINHLVIQQIVTVYLRFQHERHKGAEMAGSLSSLLAIDVGML